MGSPGLSTERFLKILFSILLSSLAVYWIIMQTLHPAARLNPLLGSMLTGAAAATAITVFFVRFRYIENLLREHAGEATSPKLPRLRGAYVVCFMLCETVALFGFTLYLMGGGIYKATLFFLAAAGLYLFCYPRLRHSDRADQ